MTSKNDSYHHGNLRDSLIDVAIEILQAEGKSGIKMREIGKRIGVSQSAAYRHFSDKSALLAAVATRGFDKLTDELRTVRNSQYSSLVEQVEQMGVIYIIFAVEHAAQYRLMYGTEAIRSDEYPELAQATRNMAREYFRMVKRCQEAGLMKGQSPIELLNVMWSATHGAAMLVIDGFIKTDDVEQFARNVVNYVDTGIRKL
ncbi:MAG: TetR/AcrR family transcriptional regulator [Chloroflexota bacterium]